MREIIAQAKTKSLDSEYKVFILDECHALSNTAWQAMLKIIEEPPAKSIFIFCTTDPNRIPKTILSRVQRYDFQRISHDGIVHRLDYILEQERDSDDAHDIDAIEYIAKIADGGMRDAITLLDKCLAYSPDITLTNVIDALGVTDYDELFRLTKSIIEKRSCDILSIIEGIHMSGKDLKQFVKTYVEFLLDVCKYDITHDFRYVQIPRTYESALANEGREFFDTCQSLLNTVIRLNADIKWDGNPKVMIESTLILESIKRGE